ncbi:hypothetical protein QVD17_02466 [Tagetes erecta]|uniref:Secreted protein n=1 Tax=Tagetes erecta TaxID=13708 RepID=A0AAD8P8W0_TARER|nr:hypothetical protein QVD17_02466 [Tagetes erecta]
MLDRYYLLLLLCSIIVKPRINHTTRKVPWTGPTTTIQRSADVVPTTMPRRYSRYTPVLNPKTALKTPHFTTFNLHQTSNH